MCGSGPDLPDAPKLEPGELSRVDAILVRCSELWMLEPLNNFCQIYDLGSGVDGLRGTRTLSTRRVGDLAVLYMQDTEAFDDYFCVSVGLQSQQIREAMRVDLPMRPGHLLTNQERTFLDRGLRKHGHSGVYGDVSGGLRALVTSFEVHISIGQDRYNFFVEPPGGYGHWLSFSMNANTGEIENSAARHFEPEPPLDDYPEPPFFDPEPSAINPPDGLDPELRSK